MIAKTPKQAKELGLKTYFTGKPCKRGEIADRRLNGDCLCDKCLEFTKKLKAQWANDNKEKSSLWRANNRDKMRKYQKEWTLRNKEQSVKAIKKWKLENKEALDESSAKRRAIKENAMASWYGELDELVMREAFSLAKLRKQATGIDWHIDHMIPLQAKECCGLHCASNIQVIPAKLNVTKINKMVLTNPYEWIKHG